MKLKLNSLDATEGRISELEDIPESDPECSITERQEMNKMKKVKRFGG